MKKIEAVLLNLGEMSISWLCGGKFQMDGGTIYGAVPKVLWSKKYPACPDNYLKMLSAPLLVRTGGVNIIIDSGLGNKLTEKQRDIFRVYKEWSLITDLEKMGLKRSDIEYVILTHCDFDHAGGLVMHENDGSPTLTFPNARHIIQEKEWYDVTHPNKRSAHTYWKENFAGLEDSSLLELVDNEMEIVPGIRVCRTGGHTRGHQLVEMQGRDCCAVHLGDLLPTHTHANPLWITAYDNFPLEVIEQKEKLLARYSSRSCWFTFYHDPFMKACKLDNQGDVIEQFGGFNSIPG